MSITRSATFGILASLIAATASHAVECRQEKAIYGDADGAFELSFSPVPDQAATTHQFKLKVLNTKVVMDGWVMPSDPLNKPAAAIHYQCPDGDVTGADIAACTIWEGIIYGHTDGAIDLLPPEGADAAAEILLPDIGSSIRMSAVWGMNKANVAPWDVFTLKGCAP